MTNAAVTAARATFDSGVTKPIDWRIRQLKALRRMLVEHTEDFARALHQDLGKSADESWLTEIGFVADSVTHLLKNLPAWLEPEKAAVPLALQPARASVVRDPLGVVLVIAPWNYPVQLLLGPVAGALSAGNAVVAKPSELAPAVAAVLAALVPGYLGGAVSVVQGGPAETTALLTERFDHIFYTGNAAVGRLVMTAAAAHLTPVTLELGGKSPVYLDRTADLKAAAKRLAWGKFLNAGQTCVAPDYVLAPPGLADELAHHLRNAVRGLFGADPRTSPDYGRII
ncbi:MAG: aldehyde dehydrogenase family protein, partial [Actinomycetales bacterium]